MTTFERKSILAGLLVGIGVIANISVDNHYISAMLFSLALLTIINSCLNLFTGKIGYYGEYNIKELASMLFHNFVGIIVITAPVFVYKGQSLIAKTALMKFDKPLWYLSVMGFLCGVCMYIAVSNKNQIITVFSIMTFILCGFEHCIADFPYVICAISAKPDLMIIIKYIVIIIGNSLGAMFINYLMKNKEIESEVSNND